MLKPLHTIVVAAVLSGCASTAPETPCARINRDIGNQAKAISSTAITRGRVDSTNVPSWVPGGKRAVSAIANRQTAQIEKLKADQSDTIAQRDRDCRL